MFVKIFRPKAIFRGVLSMCQDWFEFKPKDLQLTASSSELPEYLGNVHAQNSQYRLPLAQADSNNIVDQKKV